MSLWRSHVCLAGAIVDTDEAKQIALWRIGRLSEKAAEDYINKMKENNEQTGA